MKNKIISLMVALSFFGVTACDQSENTIEKPQASAEKNKPQVSLEENKSHVSTEASVSDKINKYVNLYNILGDYFHRDDETFEKWRVQDVAKAKSGDYKAINDKSYIFKDARDTIQGILSKPDTVDGVDEVAKEYLGIIDEYLPNWQELEAYNKAKKYEDDNGVKGKMLLLKYNEGQERLIVAQHNFVKSMDDVMEKEKEKRMASFKENGQMLEWHTNQALDKAEKIIQQFESFDDFKNKNKINKANSLLAELDTTLEAMDKEYNIRKDENKLTYRDNWDDVHASLVTFTGEYRETRKDPKHYNKMIKSYNDAIGEYNQMVGR
ncbi:DUF3829 domain-containing protein [Buttiauxella selenatireducens]|uniref:DUF3829 domain-containing protein n=1 Tax=Buttiauxella selenatireducens TaxID=3073902 RepID=A0ABY9S776_9ENTR|nr:DUF3829 domain-containing protein [Buttiauxella sp. R73]WMY72306.1 DUF3829 domain-containing protein [Buttiauxella sp. R73]